ncbi:hypothetical protein BDD43_3297 [Mucilaginibacter gracilis]|uniref:Uncharacterized protein n=1 Tax=Mucilaginibacter gracilis TaxID=423350 RepID=A0A495J299_9SPHI|nr:hypothetical protein [Mucilaginibacter gracilis]RKR83096.1 hypothetical protein BDD43_3297 [Mucilaginibacter gracilis]
MKNFIETNTNNGTGKRISIAISSIAAVEEISSVKCRIILKESIDPSGISIIIEPNFTYTAIMQLIRQGLQ